MPNPIQAVIFDQDGLMFDTESLAATSWFEVGPKYGIHVDGNFLRGIRGCKPDKVKQVCTQQFGEEAMKDYDRFREEKRQYSYRWIAEHGVPVKKGLKELLIYLKDHNIKTAVATASSESWTQGNVRGAKPNPAIFLLAARRLGVDPGACVVLEDSFNGIKAAAAGGFNPVMIPDQDQPDEEIRNLLTACCDSLTDVIGLFENGSLSLKQP